MAQSAGAAEGPPLPVAANGNEVQVFATGVAVPTQIAFKGRTAFISGGSEGPVKGGLYYVAPGAKKAKRVPRTPSNAFGVAWRGGSLYVNYGTKLVALSGWTGKGFRSSRTLIAFNPKRFNGFTGLAFGPDGRLYTGVTLQFDRKASKRPFSNSVVSISPRGGKLRTVATGLRQPWMMTFAKGIRSPFVSVLGQDTPKGTKAPDLIVKATQGSDFGFPSCNWSNFDRCNKRFDTPVLVLEPSPSPSPMGITAEGRKLYVALFNGLHTKQGPVGPEIMTTNVRGTKIRDFVTGFVAPVLLANHHGGFLYMGDLTGTVYRVRT
ncbi:MAG: hypothetical protein J0H98_04110 [Solirubrobacterales bacterium]|nr:hypothetical protein [Solirubrobacterales bacterium]